MEKKVESRKNMKITNQAADQLKSLISSNEADGILAVWINSSCGQKPLFRLCIFEEGDKPEEINGIQVLIPENLKEPLEKATLTLIQHHLILENAGCNCSTNRSCTRTG